MADPDATPTYQVLARKYRPATFADLIGQEALVRILENAFATDRIAHAFVLTGVRGVGKTTTARIVAKGLNCIGPDGTGGPTVAPCGQCGPCTAIGEGRHVDVLELDAASNTQVDKMRDILAGVPYRPTETRYKVYIFDEVHMLSTGSFNALLKTLEEPPAHVKFIFATTEIRKVPVTVLSRCQRFDLRRIEPEVMIRHLGEIAGKEGAKLSDEALAILARAADGSVRDGLSLLDQAIAHGAGEVGPEAVRAMLGLADRGRVLDLFDLILAGDAAGALREVSGQYAAGADPLAVLRDLAEIAHWISVLRITPEAADDPTVSPAEQDRGRDMAGRLSLPVLSRMWQMCLKALEEVAQAPSPMMAAEMAVIRMTHVADMPTPGDLVKKLTATPPAAAASPAATPAPAPAAPRAMAPPASSPSPPAPPPAYRPPAESAAPAPVSAPDPLARYAQFDDVVTLIRANRDVRLLVEVEGGVRLVHYAPGRIEFEPAEDAPPDLAARLSRQLQTWTGARWGVSVVAEGGAPTIAEARAARRTDLVGQALRHPMMEAVIAAFPGVTDDHVTVHEPKPVEAPPPDPDEDWDPLDDG